MGGAAMYDDDSRSEDIAKEWGVEVELLNEVEWELESIDGNDGETYGFIVKFNPDTDPSVLEALGVPPGELQREVSVSAFDEPDYEPNIFKNLKKKPNKKSVISKRKTRYFGRGDDVGVTPSKLKRMSAKRQLEYLTHWFEIYYEDPANQTSYNTREGGYLWNHGGPYDAAEELYSEFAGIVSEEVIQIAADEVQDESGTFEWAATSAHPDMREVYDEAMSETFSDEGLGDRPKDEILAQVQRLLASGALPTYRTSRELALRREILKRLSAVEAELAKLKPVHGGIGHNNPPADELDDDEGLLEQSREATAVIQGELGKQKTDASKVADSASSLSKAAKFLAKKATEKALDEVAKSVLGSSVAQAVILAASVAIYAAYEKVVEWLYVVTSLF